MSGRLQASRFKSGSSLLFEEHCTLIINHWRDVREAEGARLESVCSFVLPRVRIPLSPLLFSGAVAQLGERYVRNVQVVGSTPIGSTLAVLDGELAVPCNLQSATAGSKIHLEVGSFCWSPE